MTNTIALALGALILGALAVDYAIWGSEHLVFLGQKFIALLHWVAFWR